MNYLRRNKNNKLKHRDKKTPAILTEVFTDYLTNSTLHGISYLGADDKNLIEKIWWVIGLILSVTACTYFVNKTWTKWKENPVMVSFAQEYTSVNEIPFPAVTVCPFNKIMKSKFNYMGFLNHPPNGTFFGNTTEHKTFWHISLTCAKDLMLIGDMDHIVDENVITNIKMVAPSLSETVTRPSWLNYVGVRDFVEQITTEGLCFTFNALEHHDMYTDNMKKGFHIIEYNREAYKNTTWSMETGYAPAEVYNEYPLRTDQTGLDYGLAFELSGNTSERTQYCAEDILGYKMMLHNPAEVPRVSENFFLVPVNQKVIVAVTPKVIRTSKNLEDVSPLMRTCYFPHEKKLRFFKVYTQYNCKTECLSNVTLEHCKCVPFDLPRDDNAKICGYGNMGCLVSARTIAELGSLEKCNCLTSCNSIDYEFDISQADYKYNNLHSTSKFEKTQVNIFFKQSTFLAIERNELYGQTDFIANIGGLLGLCMGFSFLSILEIFYYVTLRIWCKFYNKNNIKSQQSKQISDIPTSTLTGKFKNKSTMPWIE